MGAGGAKWGRKVRPDKSKWNIKPPKKRGKLAREKLAREKRMAIVRERAGGVSVGAGVKRARRKKRQATPEENY